MKEEFKAGQPVIDTRGSRSQANPQMWGRIVEANDQIVLVKWPFLDVQEAFVVSTPHWNNGKQAWVINRSPGERNIVINARHHDKVGLLLATAPDDSWIIVIWYSNLVEAHDQYDFIGAKCDEYELEHDAEPDYEQFGQKIGTDSIIWDDTRQYWVFIE